jgi:cytochrome c oxidase subunit 3
MRPAVARSTTTIGVWLAVGAILLLFLAFTSTLLVRRAEPDWHTAPVPPLLWANTAVLLASSAVLEWARAGRGRTRRRLGLGVGGATALGAAFLVGQWVAWRRLLASGVSLTAGPHSAFFYLLTGVHAVHVAVGVGVLAYAWWRTHRATAVADAAEIVTPAAIYWHVVAGLWLYVFGVLFIG